MLHDGNIGKHHDFPSSILKDPGYPILVETITQRAQGVFLWAFFVVRSLLSGMHDENDIHYMRTRIDDFPVDLEQYFSRIMKSIELIYRQQSAQIFHLVLNVNSPLSPLALWFFEKEKDCPDYAMNLIEGLDTATFPAISQSVRTHLNAYCKDLLEITCDHNPAGTSRLTYKSLKTSYDICVGQST